MSVCFVQISLSGEILFAVNGCIFWFLKLAALIFFQLLPAFYDPILSTLRLLFVPEEEELYLLETLVLFCFVLFFVLFVLFFFFVLFCFSFFFFSVIFFFFCSFSVLLNDVAVFQLNVSLPHYNGKFV